MHMALFCRNHKCAIKDACERYRRGKDMNFQNDEGLWYVHSCDKSNKYKHYVWKGIL